MHAKRRFVVENLHSQIADDLIRRIASGFFAAGSTLPTDTELAREYGVAPNTVRRALDHIADLQLIDRRKGRVATVNDVVGWRQVTTLISIIDRQGVRILGLFEQRNARVEMASEVASAALHYRAPRPILRFDRFRTHEGRCFMVEDVHVTARSDELEGDQEDLDRLSREIWWNREVAQSKRERVWVETATETDADPLGLALGQPVLCIERVLFGTRCQPLEYRIGRCNLGTDLLYVST